MATRANIAARDRFSKEDIANKDRKLKEKLGKKELDIKQFEANSKHLKNSARAVKDITGAASSLGAMMNHPEWYKKFGSDKFVDLLPTFARTGLVTIDGFLAKFAGPGGYLFNGQQVLPGICVIEYLSTLPNQTMVAGTGYKSSPINVGLSRFMSELRKLNSRVGEYDPSDYGLYWYAGVDYMYLIERVRQGIAAYNTYYIDNAYYAKAVIEALGFDADDFFDNIAKYKYLCNKHIKQFNSSSLLPKNLTFVLRRLWLARCIVKDHTGTNAQIYLFRQRRLCHLSQDEDCVIYGTGDFTSQTYVAVEGYLDTMYNSMVDSVGIQVMLADLRAGIPADNFLKLEDLDENATLNIGDGTEELEQIHNLRTLPGVVSGSSQQCVDIANPSYLTIYSMTDGYLCQGQVDSALTTMIEAGPHFGVSGSTADVLQELQGYIDNHDFLNFYDSDPDSDDVIEATRLMSPWYINGDNDIKFGTRGTEIVTNYAIYVFDTAQSLRVFKGYTCVLSQTTTGNLLIALEQSAIISKFDWLPKCMVVAYVVPASGASYIDTYFTIGEIDKVVPISKANLYNLHEQCTLSTFYVDASEFFKDKR